ncbi:MAG TPA: endonuclease [Candidatus Margulisbacteria bacterium]|nr:MAG: hypothetical protein A2X43_06030 [Candidatus Margulisbacteria bacterium GWD2_39_127]HAR62271.1 endonuclease [Candidatus Margulisiibacteriota bacterium]
MEKYFYVYILASKKNGTLYIGVTSDLKTRIYEHKNNLLDGFTKKYGVHNLVYFEQYADSYNAIQREKRIKVWKRDWKIKLIHDSNPDWMTFIIGCSYGSLIRTFRDDVNLVCDCREMPFFICKNY